MKKDIKKRFTKGFWWGKVEHKLEKITTIFLLISVLLSLVGIVERRWWYIFAALAFNGVSLLFRVSAGLAHRIEKHYMDKLRFGSWKK